MQTNNDRNVYSFIQNRPYTSISTVSLVAATILLATGTLLAYFYGAGLIGTTTLGATTSFTLLLSGGFFLYLLHQVYSNSSKILPASPQAIVKPASLPQPSPEFFPPNSSALPSAVGIAPSKKQENLLRETSSPDNHKKKKYLGLYAQ